MKKILFPEWSPKDLVNIYHTMKNDNERSKLYNEQLNKEEPDIESFKKYELRAVKDDKLEKLLYRLLTDLNMKSVWSILFSKQPLHPHRLKREPARSLWVSITSGLERFNNSITYQLTPAQKVNSLKSISAQTETLLKSISKNPYAKLIAKEVVNAYLCKKNIELRESEEENIDWMD